MNLKLSPRGEALRRAASRSTGTLRQVIVRKLVKERMTDQYGNPKPFALGLSGLGASPISKWIAKAKAKKTAKKVAKRAAKAAPVAAHAAVPDVTPQTTVLPASVPATSIPATTNAVANNVAATIMDAHPEYAPEAVAQAVAEAMPEQALTEETQYEVPDVYSAAYRGQEEPPPAEAEPEESVADELLNRGWVGQPTADGVQYEEGQPTYSDAGGGQEPVRQEADLETMLLLADQEIEGAELRQGDVPEGEDAPSFFDGFPEMFQNPLVLGALAAGAIWLLRKKIR